MKAVVNVPACPLTVEPRPGCALADEALFGMELEVLEKTTPGWWRVRTPYRYEGYAQMGALAVGERTVGKWAVRPKKIVRYQNFCDVMDRPDFRARSRLTLPLGSAVAAVGEPVEGWQKVVLPDGAEGYVRAGVLAVPPPEPQSLPEEVLRRNLVDAALHYRHAPYRWGGKTPVGVDCSGLVSMAYLLNEITVYRDAALRSGFDLVEIPREKMAPGDALFFPGHVALYLGDGRYLHATGRAGDDGVRVNSLGPQDPTYREDLANALIQVGSYRGFYR